ncbi:uncharacterized protein LOC108666791 [Hyalella azteca]|uniref:Uncharacterized protein LOC108666791 n=1 Tax=Hyalella azteca TaxID=294128 RepID=A0A8B7N5S5_HYAAZ|nr:uncharacterized protein LOC108666791 [Hyalella azteca]
MMLGTSSSLLFLAMAAMATTATMGVAMPKGAKMTTPRIDARFFGFGEQTTTRILDLSTVTTTQTCIVITRIGQCARRRKRHDFEARRALPTLGNDNGDAEIASSLLDSSRSDEGVAAESFRGFLTYWHLTTSTVVLTSYIKSIAGTVRLRNRTLGILGCTATLCKNA